MAHNDAPEMERYTRDFITGLLAKPGSPERREAGRRLEIEIAHGFERLPVSTDESKRRDVALTRKILGWTVDYMKSASPACAPEERVRLYRGVGVEPIVRAPGAAAGFNAFSSFNGALLGALVDLHIVARSDLNGPSVSYIDGLDTGEQAFKHLRRMNRLRLAGFDYARMLGKGVMADAELMNIPGLDGEDVDGRWFPLAAIHTDGNAEDWGSPLHSTTLVPATAARFGPATLTLSVCPERAIPGVGLRYLSEAEVYVPLFIFPEEIVAMEGFDCQFTVGDRDRSCTEDIVDAAKEIDITPANDTTRAYMVPLFGFLSKFELKYLLSINSDDGTFVSDEHNAAFVKNRDLLYATYKAATSAADLRARMRVAASGLQPSCASLQGILNDAFSEGAQWHGAIAAEMPVLRQKCPNLSQPR